MHLFEETELTSEKSLLDFSDLVMKIFRLSRYESFLAFKVLTQGPKLNMSVFIEQINNQVKAREDE